VGGKARSVFDDEHGDYIIRYPACIYASSSPVRLTRTFFTQEWGYLQRSVPNTGRETSGQGQLRPGALSCSLRHLAHVTSARFLTCAFSNMQRSHVCFVVVFSLLSIGPLNPLPIVCCIHDLNTKSPIVWKSSCILPETLAAQVVRVYDTVGKTYLAMKVPAPPHLSPNHHSNLGSNTTTQTHFPHSKVHLNPFSTLRNVILLSTKIIKNKRAFHEQAQVEIQMLSLFKNFGEVSMWCGVLLSFCPSVTRHRLRSITAALFACWTALCTGTISV
jgi:hypothetical protein